LLLRNPTAKSGWTTREFEIMIPIFLGIDKQSAQKLYLEPDQFHTHFHLVGATGSGKSTAIQTLLRPILMQTRSETCALFLIDPMGNLSRDLLGWMVNERLCPQQLISTQVNGNDFQKHKGRKSRPPLG